MTTKIVFLDRETIPDYITLKPFDFDHSFEVYPRTQAHEVAHRIKNANIVITNKVPITASDIEKSPNLKLIAVAATGANIVFSPACHVRDIVITNIEGYAVNTVPEHTFALMLALTRSIVPYHRSVQEGRWTQHNQFCYFDYPIIDLAGKTLGLFGSGSLGTSVATIAKAFGMKVMFAARKGQEPKNQDYHRFEDVLKESDILSFHIPLTSESKNMISDAEFALMKPSALLINTARGGIVNEPALVRALKEKKIAGAAFDVLSTEPMPANHPFYEILNLPNFILTPHVAWGSQEAVKVLSDQLIDNINAFMRGDIRNRFV